MAAKKRIATLADKYEVPGELLLKLLTEKGFEVRSTASLIGSEEFKAVKDDLLAEKEKLASRKGGIRKASSARSSGGASKNDGKSEDSSRKRKFPAGAKITLKKAPVKDSDSAEDNQPVAGESTKTSDKEAHAVSESLTPAKAPSKTETASDIETSSAAKKDESSAAASEAKANVENATDKVAEKSKEAAEKTEGVENPANTDAADVSAKPAQAEPKPEVSPNPSAGESESTEKASEDTDSTKAKESDSSADSIDKSEADASPAKAETQESSTASDAPALGAAVISEKHEGKSAPMKAQVELPSADMAARIQKYAANKRRPGKSGPGYTGNFGNAAPDRRKKKKPAGPGGPGGPGGPRSDSPRGPGGGSAGGGTGAPGAGGMPMPSDKGAAPGKDGARGPNWKKGGKKKAANKQTKAEKQKEQIEAVKQNVKSVMATLSKAPARKVHKKKAAEEDGVEEKPILKVSDFTSVGELAGLMEQMPAKVIAKCMENGMMVTINHRLDFDTIELLADEFGYTAELMDEYDLVKTMGEETEEDDANQEPRSPIVTVMGHVDHGKTSVLDWVRSENVVAGESGGITQHIGAYEVHTPHGSVTFLDTPGHEAFTAMRSRGSQVTDVIVLVVAADDQVMPQTIESIELAKASKVPMVVAINKVDLENANPDKIRAQLAERGVEVEQWGGSVSCVEVSAKTGLGMDKLLETLALETEVLELKANPATRGKGTVVESQLDRGKGSVATVLVQNGTLRVGDPFVCGIYSGKIRAMLDERGNPKEISPPSSAAQIMGFDGTPQAGDDFIVVEDEKTARDIATKRRIAARERDLRFRRHMTLEHIYDRVQSGEFTELNLIIKADVDGSAEAIAASLEKLSNREVKINIVRKGVGAVNETDVNLASASDAVIIAFHLLPSRAVRELADIEGVQIKNYRIIYEIIEEISGVVEGMLAPSVKEQEEAQAEVRELFKIPKVGWIAGCIVSSGTVKNDANLRVYRSGVEVGTATIHSLKHHKDVVKEVKSGTECGIALAGFDGIQVGDTLGFFRTVQVARTLGDLEREEKERGSKTE